MYYILEGHETKQVDTMTWAKMFVSADRHVAKEMVGDAEISTVFFGFDHAFGGGPPLLFETMIFGGPLDQEQKRYATWEEAEAGHKDMVERVKSVKT